MSTQTKTLDPAAVTTILCDADGNLFPSEEIAFEASVGVTNDLAAELGMEERFDSEQLRLATTGKNFRTLAKELSAGTGQWEKPQHQLGQEDLERWIAEEKRVVSDYLNKRLEPDSDVVDVLGSLAKSYGLAVVSSSALSRLQKCFEATDLEQFFAPERVFSAEDSLPTPVSKPDPAVYLQAIKELGLTAGETLAIEDSLPGAQSAVAAGCQVIGNLRFVAPAEREQRRRELEEAGVAAVISSWPELLPLLRG
ncbi:HAD family phosphatase [Arthrobacter sp. zg-Y859]|uniref:HAD family phosphatase n=1 Tax=Arthrobacter jinronghuae TaxID=2964609 RepID=A0ABT1NQ15_9MICC|nr:HAD family phosphatase [Arthrobacter jinronghuae]MCQ1948641.1 HAD family phosphatase [Arthrobacter jinronghuae]UWX78544.1 HAD family phosphatase [Arthrobacter jinronghuae]